MTLDSQLNVITGETGAGKSIMLGAVGLLIGNRADTRTLLDEQSKCIIEGSFDLAQYKLRSIFEAYDIEYEENCIIRREISPTGKSRAFVNDSPATLQTLKAIGEKLMDVHSQHESLRLGDHTYQLQVLDAFAGHDDLLSQFEVHYNLYKKAEKELAELQKRASEGAEDLDYKQFLMTELEEASLDDQNKTALEKELEMLENAENIKVNLSKAAELMDQSELAVLNQLNEIRSHLQSISSFSEEIESGRERIESVSIELQDISNELSRLQDHTEHDPERIQSLKEHLDLLNRLEKKHNVLTIEELIKIRNQLDVELQSTLNLDAEIAEAKKSFELTKKEMNAVGDKLTESRRLSSLNFSDEIEKIIRRIGIENGIIEIQVQKQEPTNSGLDKIVMLFSANKGIKPQELEKVASGGEFSRLIFAIKYLIADKTALPTIIFDEIDTGVSGEVALQMIQMMKQMAQNHQVISISHLPQFAAGGDSHYFVYKDHSTERSVSKIKKLEKEDRVIEIAKMIGGQEPSNSAFESARELLQLS